MGSLWLELAVYFLGWCFLLGLLLLLLLLLLLFMRGAQYSDDDADFLPHSTSKGEAGASVKTSI